MSKSFLLTTILLCVVGIMTHAQQVPYRGSKHYNTRMKQFEQEGVLPDNAIIMLGDSHSEYGGDWNRPLKSSADMQP